MSACSVQLARYRVTMPSDKVEYYVHARKLPRVTSNQNYRLALLHVLACRSAQAQSTYSRHGTGRNQTRHGRMGWVHPWGWIGLGWVGSGLPTSVRRGLGWVESINSWVGLSWVIENVPMATSEPA